MVAFSLPIQSEGMTVFCPRSKLTLWPCHIGTPRVLRNHGSTVIFGPKHSEVSGYIFLGKAQSTYYLFALLEIKDPFMRF